MSPVANKSWFLEGRGSFDNLKLKDNVKLPELADNDVLVKFHAASLNFRDLVICMGRYPVQVDGDVVPGSDGAGTVLAVGSQVTRFRKDDKVITLFNQGHLSGLIDARMMATGLGGMLDGTLRSAGIYSEQGLVSLPENLNFLQGATLTCAGLTAWNALYGLRPLKTGEIVLTQGTGGVSLFAVQFAKAAGATVISTTSSADKMEVLKKLGADHVINYKETENWGEKAKELAGGNGVHHVIEVGGAKTMKQSLAAVRPEAIISIIGFVGGNDDSKEPKFLECLSKACTVRGILVGSRAQFEEMNAAIVANNIQPVLDSRVFKLEEAKEAYQYQWDQKHVGKICISID